MPGVLESTINFIADRLDRRGFLTRAAVVGSAVVAAPLEFGLRPRSAYAAICNCNGSNCPCGSLCCDGYSEFCCTLYGANACPPGTITAGWWKVDGSQFCGGAARYYLDCNAQCGTCGCGPGGVCSGACSGTGCGCAQGNCGNRKSGCTRFRYGQCNQQVPCVGPIVCRVVTCAPPWSFDPACSTTSRTDNATRNHDRPCLNEPFGALETVEAGDGTVRVSGWAVANTDYDRAGYRILVGDRFVSHGLAELPRPDVKFAYPAFPPGTGLDVTVNAPAGKQLVCLWGVDRRNGRQSLIGMREVVVGGPVGALEGVDTAPGQVVVRGWALSGARRRKRATVRVFVDTGFVAELPLTDLPRPDVVAANPGAALESGFRVPVAVAPGKHLVCLWATDPETGAQTIIDAEEVVVP